MRVRKSEIKKGVLQNVLKKKPEPKPDLVKDRTDEVLNAIKNLNPRVDNEIPKEILEQQRLMIEKLSEVEPPKDFPAYRFNVNRTSDGFIKSVDAIPTKTDNDTVRNIGDDWYEKG
jgi:hypothetical protein